MRYRRLNGQHASLHRFRAVEAGATVTDELVSRLAGAAHELWRAQRWSGPSTHDMARVSSHSERSWSAVRSRMGPSSAVRGLFGDADIPHLFINEIGSEFCFSFVLGLF